MPMVAWLLLALAASAADETPAIREPQVSFDEAGEVSTVDREAELGLRLFPDVPGFVEARLYETSATAWALEITTAAAAGSRVRERRQLTAEEFHALRESVAAARRRLAEAAPPDRTGRAALVTASTLLGLGFYGSAVTVALRVPEGRAAVASFMLVAGSGFLIPFALTRTRPVTAAQAVLGIYGGYAGIAHGMYAKDLLLGAFNPDGGDDRAGLAAGVLGSVAEGLAGWWWAGRAGMSPGSAGMIEVGATYGTMLGVAAADLADWYRRASDPARPIAATILAGVAGGYGLGSRLARDGRDTAGNALVTATAMWLGAYAPLWAVDTVRPHDHRWYTAASVLGGTAGLAAGRALVRGEAFTAGQGVLVLVGSVACGLTGLGIAYLVTPDNAGSRSTSYLGLSALGGVAGFAFLHRTFRGRGGERSDAASWRFALDPAALLALRSGAGTPASAPRPLVTLARGF